VFLTVSQSKWFSGLVPKIGSVCDSARDRRVSITKYLNGDAKTAMVIHNIFSAPINSLFYVLRSDLCRH